MSKRFRSTANLIFRAAMSVGALTAGTACTSDDATELATTTEAVVGVGGAQPAASGDKMAGLFGDAVNKPAAFKPYCSGSIAKWTDTKNHDKPMVTAVTAAHCVASDTADMMAVFPDWLVGGDPAAIKLNGWKRSSGSLAGVGDVAAATFCPNLTKQAEPWKVAATEVGTNTNVTVHGMRQVANNQHPNEKKDKAPELVYSQADVFGPKDRQVMSQRAEKTDTARNRLVGFQYWITRPGDSGAGGKVGDDLVYVNSGAMPRDNAGHYRSIGTRVTQSYMVDLWNSTIAALEGDFDMTGYQAEPSTGNGPGYREIDCSSTVTSIVIADGALPPLTGSPAVPTYVRAVGTAADIGEFWHPDYPPLLLDTKNGPRKIWGGGIPPHSQVVWTFTPEPPPPPTPCTPDPELGLACVDEEVPTGPVSTDYWARVVRWAPDGSHTVICSACNPGTCTESSVPHDFPRYTYSVELAGCPVTGGGGTGGGGTGGGGSGSGGGGAGSGGGGMML